MERWDIVVERELESRRERLYQSKIVAVVERTIKIATTGPGLSYTFDGQLQAGWRHLEFT
jgi:hypothetical protein